MSSISPLFDYVTERKREIVGRVWLQNMTYWRIYFQIIASCGGYYFGNVRVLIAQIVDIMKRIKKEKIAPPFSNSSCRSRRISSNVFYSETVIERIVSFLDYKSVCRVCSVSKIWNKIAASEPIWERLMYKDFAIHPHSAYCCSRVGLGRSKDVYLYSMRLFRFAVYGRKKESSSSRPFNSTTSAAV